MFEYLKGLIDGRFVSLTRLQSGYLTSAFVMKEIDRVKKYKSKMNRRLNTPKITKLTTEAVYLINQKEANAEKSPSTDKEKAVIDCENRFFTKRACEIFSILKSKELIADEKYKRRCERAERKLGVYFSGVAMKLNSVNPEQNSLLKNIAPDVLESRPAISSTISFISKYIQTGDLDESF